MTIPQIKTQALDIKVQLDRIQKLIENYHSPSPTLTKEGYNQEIDKLLKEYEVLFNVYKMFINELKK